MAALKVWFAAQYQAVKADVVAFVAANKVVVYSSASTFVVGVVVGFVLG